MCLLHSEQSNGDIKEDAVNNGKILIPPPKKSLFPWARNYILISIIMEALPPHKIAIAQNLENGF